MANASFPEPKDLDVDHISDGISIAGSNYSLSNPHPGFGKDPNILNELGHTVYPKWVDSKDGSRVVVNNPIEESQVTGEEIKEPAKQATGWD